MNWKEYINKITSVLTVYLEKDIQYSKLQKNNIRRIAIREIEIFIQEFKNWDPKELILKENTEINIKDQKIINEFLKKRGKGIPLAYIIGKQEFYGLSFEVDKNTLIPRPETEELVERASKFISKRFSSNHNPLLLIDVGTGSGCIIISVMKDISDKIKDCKAYAIDLSEKALKIASRNAIASLGKQIKVKFLKGKLLSPLKKIEISQSVFLIIIANLPYLSEKEYNNLSREVKDFEPEKALIGGKKGHELICQLIGQVSMLKVRGKVFLELSPTAYPAVKQYCASFTKPLRIKKFTDINGKVRIAEINF